MREFFGAPTAWTESERCTVMSRCEKSMSDHSSAASSPKRRPVRDATRTRSPHTVAPAAVTSAWRDASSRNRKLGSGATLTTFAYTANGERSEQRRGVERTTYAYDLLGNLRRVQPSQGQAIDYLYDALGRRVARRVGGTVTQRLLYLDDLRPAAELDASGTRLAAVYLYGSRRNVPDYVITYGADGTQSGTFRIITDHLGSPRVVVNTATEAIMAGEAVVASVRYDEWGNEQDYSARAGWRHLPFGYAGGLVDRDPMTGALVTKLVHFGAREYDPETRQWLTRDPSGFGGGLNLYGYVVGDPINRVDADGNHPALVAVVVAAGVGALQELASQWIHGHGSLDCIDRRAVFEAAVIGAAFEVGAGAIALGVGVWSGRTLFRASRATGRFRPSFTYEAGPGVNVYADTAADGIIDFGIYNNRSVPGVTGTDLLRRMMNYYGPRARAVRGNWYSGTNLEQFNAFRSLNYTEAEAAASTFTGRGLEAYGFRVDPSALRVTYGSEGATEVIATFVR